MEQLQLLPLGIQDFSKLRKDHCLYIDKTSIIYELIHSNNAVFLSRPRRFGKSLLLSTIKYYFLGRKDLFSGLAIEKLENESKEPWVEYPVMYFSLASGERNTTCHMKNILLQFALQRLWKMHTRKQAEGLLSLLMNMIILF